MNHAIANRLAKLERQAQPSAQATQLVIVACDEADAERQLAKKRAAGKDPGGEPFVILLTPLQADS